MHTRSLVSSSPSPKMQAVLSAGKIQGDCYRCLKEDNLAKPGKTNGSLDFAFAGS